MNPPDTIRMTPIADLVNRFATVHGWQRGMLASTTDNMDCECCGEQVPANALLEWEVPFDFPADWPESARTAFDAFHAARQAMQRKMDESIDAHADQEVLYDQPQKAKDARLLRFIDIYQSSPKVRAALDKAHGKLYQAGWES